MWAVTTIYIKDHEGISTHNLFYYTQWQAEQIERLVVNDTQQQLKFKCHTDF